MGESYRQCDECGKRALRIATRCPGCGRELPATEQPEESLAVELGRRFVSPSVMTALGAVALVLLVAELAPTGESLGPPPPGITADTATPAVASAMGARASLDSAATLEAAQNDAGRLLVAPTWTNVRKSRSRNGALEAVLTPGDTVLADSLDRGWYRVALEGEVLGYAHRSTLTLP
jgi:hypothetical protein